MMTAADEPHSRRPSPEDFEVWLLRGATLVVASVAAYASYVRQRAFAVQGGADGMSATLWPFSVDGLFLLEQTGRSAQAGSKSEPAVAFESRDSA
jgi:hypothetical protein